MTIHAFSDIIIEAGGAAACGISKGAHMRKVRASQGRITDNVRRRKLPGKCNRNSLPKQKFASAGTDGKAR